MLGVFDSGLGGLSVVRRLRERLPHHDLLFFADQAHVPYGGRQAEDLARLLRQNVTLLNDAGVSMIVMGCNTTCAIAQRFGWPQSAARILDLIEAAVIAVERSGAKRIGVVATEATVNTGAYTNAITARIAGARVTQIAAPALVPLVERGLAGTQEAHDAVAGVCAQLPHDLDAVVLACTHYPILDLHFADALGEGVRRIDPALVQADRAAEFAGNGVLPIGLGEIRYCTNGDVETFRTSVRMIAGDFNPDVRALQLHDMK
ncbi:MAG: glutamate racemase [Candidatus Eremiobacteraeota bacterium]|nr:glutamate racemase [Candidatus Eremiobacteraeota bacterium]